MKLIGLYTWLIGTKAEYLKQFSNVESLYQRSMAFWNNIEGSTSLLFIAMLIISILFAILYYTWWNNKPGRHYTLGSWVWFAIWACLATFIFSFGIEFFETSPDSEKEWILIVKLSACNILYSIVFYFLISVIWCNFLPTNACRIFNIGRIS